MHVKYFYLVLVYPAVLAKQLTALQDAFFDFVWPRWKAGKTYFLELFYDLFPTAAFLVCFERPFL